MLGVHSVFVCILLSEDHKTLSVQTECGKNCKLEIKREK